ncbi:MAG: hypothetical protein HOY79_17905 [Streptomyces sp.]|nr:hypothetical protein [Streptomyces sp.]
MTFPLTFPDDDPRFTSELIDEISAVLTAHGYPAIDGDDTAFAGLREAIQTFLYGTEFNRGDIVTWMESDGRIWSGKVEFVTNTEDGPVARILTDPQPGYRRVITVADTVPCRELTLVPGGAS